MVVDGVVLEVLDGEIEVLDGVLEDGVMVDGTEVGVVDGVMDGVLEDGEIGGVVEDGVMVDGEIGGVVEGDYH